MSNLLGKITRIRGSQFDSGRRLTVTTGAYMLGDDIDRPGVDAFLKRTGEKSVVVMQVVEVIELPHQTVAELEAENASLEDQIRRMKKRLAAKHQFIADNLATIKRIV